MKDAAERAAERTADDARQADEDLRAVMSEPGGRRFLWRHFAHVGVLESTFTADALTSAFQQGRREAGLELMAEVKRVAPNEYVQMFSEAVEADRTRRLLEEADQ